MPRKRILIVDDDKDFASTLAFSLEERGFACSIAPDGPTALQKAVRERPDLILLDLMMPGMTGDEVCERLRSDFCTSHIPIVMITVRNETRDKILAIERGVDDYIAKPFEIEEFVARLTMILRRIESSLGSNPLTRLPGNTAIHKEIASRICQGGTFAVGYCDIDNFKAYDDRCGYARGDIVIRKVGALIVEAVEANAGEGSFVGHIGGDDFLFLVTPERVEAVCTQILREFDALVPQLYDKEDRARGYIEAVDRQGRKVRFPLLSLSIGVVTNLHRKFRSHLQVAEIATEMKNFAKRFPGSVYRIDKRQQ